MNKKVKKKWITALRSGQYDQIQGTLCAETTSSGRTGFCCLGVLCNIHAEESSGGGWEESRNYKSKSKFVGSKGKVKKIMSKELSYLGSGEETPKEVASWSGLDHDDETTLIEMNDKGENFTDIAFFIENEL
ncbi:hypothetical protein LCGC14_0318920 [marine sediment metagenome]|uniref:Uncharacterized protein n=1 Tax=marine sediment metagenome TaxID=412755 RepID=A0A0F9WS48_9ZZZZ